MGHDRTVCGFRSCSAERAGVRLGPQARPPAAFPRPSTPAITALAVEEVRFPAPLTPFLRDLPVVAAHVEDLLAAPDPATPLVVAESTHPPHEVPGYAMCGITDRVRPGRSGAGAAFVPPGQRRRSPVALAHPAQVIAPTSSYT